MGQQTSIIARAVVTFIVTLTLSISALAQSGHAESSPPAGAQGDEPESLFFTAERLGNLSVFFKAVKAAGLTDTLKGAGPFTVFAPTDEAFAKLPAETLDALFRPQNRDRLRALLITHIYAARATSSEIQGLRGAVTLRRISLPVDTSDGLKVGGASVTRPDIIASNGVLHLIDTVILSADND